MPPPEWPTVAGAAYRGLIDDQLRREDDRKTSFEARGLSIVTTASGLITLVFALSALVKNTTKFTLGAMTTTLLAVALASLILAAVSGILSNMPQGYGEVEKDDLERLLQPRFWLGRIAIGQLRVAEAELEQIVLNRTSNDRKGKLLVIGLGFEVLAVLIIAVAALLILT
jgi:hypothetical protein